MAKEQTHTARLQIELTAVMQVMRMLKRIATDRPELVKLIDEDGMPACERAIDHVHSISVAARSI